MATKVNNGFALEVAELIQTYYVGLIRQDGTEASIDRQPFGTVNVDSSSSTTHHIISNANTITFPTAPTDVAPTDNPVAKIGIYKNLTETTPLIEVDVEPLPKPYLTGDQFIILNDALKVLIQKDVS